jgi:hypothetical protein
MEITITHRQRAVLLEISAFACTCKMIYQRYNNKSSSHDRDNVQIKISCECELKCILHCFNHDTDMTET